MLETYAAMLNRKLLIPVARTRYIAVETSYWTEFFGLSIANIDIDEAWYIDRYQDVAKAIADNVVKTAGEHYCQSGYFEHRMPYYINVEPEWYIEQYGDVREAIVKSYLRRHKSISSLSALEKDGILIPDLHCVSKARRLLDIRN